MTETKASYAAQVVEVLREHFPDLAGDPEAAGIIAAAVSRQMADPRDSFEVIVDSPWTANWRLKARPGGGVGCALPATA